MDWSWISNGLRIQEDLVKIIRENNRVKEKEADQDKIGGDAMIAGVVDHLPTREALPVIAETKTYKHLYLFVQEIRCNSLFI